MRKFKSEKQISLKQELSGLILVSEDKDFKAMFIGIEKDLKAVLQVREIFLQGETSLESEQFKVKVGIVR